MIEGVRVTALSQFPDERGSVMHMLRSDSPIFIKFGEIYFSTVHSGQVKAWHNHKVMTLNYAVPHGEIKFVLYDDRKKSTTQGETQEIFMGPENYVLVTVPPGIWSGFKGLSPDTAIVANCATIPHDPEEIDRCDPSNPEIGYNWSLTFG